MNGLLLAIWVIAVAWPIALLDVARSCSARGWLDPFEHDDPRASIDFDVRTAR